MRGKSLDDVLHRFLDSLGEAREGPPPSLRAQEVGIVDSVGKGVARIRGLPDLGSEEMVSFPGGVKGLAFNLDPGEVGVVLLGEESELEAGQEVRPTGRVVDVPVGEEVLGRVMTPLGEPLDGGGRIRARERRGVEQPAPAIMARGPVRVPLQTGLKVVDALVPVGRGQRELIVGDRQTGKTAVALDTILNQEGEGVACVYCAVAQRSASVARVIDELRERGAMEHTAVVVAQGEDPPGLQFLAPYAATSMAEFFRDRGEDALVVFDDLTRHARAYRELSLLLRRPPGREGYPGDIFYIHSRLLERATRLKDEEGGGSLTALPVVETQEGNISAYIPTNLISITDGQIFLSPDLFQKGIIPAVDVGRSVSRVGGDAQLPAYRAVVQDLRLSYSQFQELEVFSRFASQLDEETRHKLRRGRRIREVFKQDEHAPLTPCQQMAVLLAVTRGVLDDVPLEKAGKAIDAIQDRIRERPPEACRLISDREELEDEDLDRLVEEAREAVEGAAEAETGRGAEEEESDGGEGDGGGGVAESGAESGEGAEGEEEAGSEGTDEGHEEVEEVDEVGGGGEGEEDGKGKGGRADGEEEEEKET